MKLKPLGIVKEFVEEAGMSISHVYDDLIFIDHNAFLLQFADNDSELVLHVNRDADPSAIQANVTRLREKASARKVDVRDGSRYTINQDTDENLRLEFGNDNIESF